MLGCENAVEFHGTSAVEYVLAQSTREAIHDYSNDK
jgi:hypothetical protein